MIDPSMNDPSMNDPFDGPILDDDDVRMAGMLAAHEADLHLQERMESRTCLCRTCRGTFTGISGQAECPECELD